MEGGEPPAKRGRGAPRDRSGQGSPGQGSPGAATRPHGSPAPAPASAPVRASTCEEPPGGAEGSAAFEEEFMSWVRGRGAYVSDKVSLFCLDSSGDRRVRAVAPVARGEMLMLVPTSACISSFGGRQGCGGGAGSWPDTFDWERWSPHLRGVLSLLWEMCLGDESEYAPYVRSLPHMQDHMLFWSSQERALLAGTSADPDTEVATRALFHGQILPAMEAAGPGAWPPGAREYERFARACALVSSRAFHLEDIVNGGGAEEAGAGAAGGAEAEEAGAGAAGGAEAEEAEEAGAGELYMIPAVDQLNHTRDQSLRNTTLRMIHEPMSVVVAGGRVVEFSSALYMKAEREVLGGEEILHSYGALSDAQTLQTYGFVEERPTAGPNPHNAVRIDGYSVVRARGGKAQPRHVRYLAEVGALDRWAGWEVTGADPLPTGLLAACAIACGIPDHDFEALPRGGDPRGPHRAVPRRGGAPSPCSRDRAPCGGPGGGGPPREVPMQGHGCDGGRGLGQRQGGEGRGLQGS